MTARDTPPDLDAAHDGSAAELARRAGELARLEVLTLGWEPSQQSVLSAIKTGIEELNAEAFKRLIRTLKTTRPRPPRCARRCATRWSTRCCSSTAW